MANFKIDENNNISRTSSSSKKGKATFSVSENGNIKRNKVEKKQKNGFFQSSKYFDNGYDFGDISKTFFWSGADLLQDVTRGFSRTIEGTIDTLGYLSADVLDFFGADNTADWLRDVSKYDVTGKLIKDSNYLEQRSVFGNYSDTVFEGVGNVGAMALTAGVTGGGVPSTVFSSFSSSYGNTMSEALRNGEDLSTARKAAFINGTAEAISEQFFSGLPGLKTENWGGKLLGKIGSGVERYFGTNTGKLAMKILNASGEGFEEIISNMLTSAGNDLMHKFDKNFTYGMEGQTGNILEDVKRAATSKESWNSFISAALTSALTNGGNQFISNTQKNNLIKSYAKENNITVNQVKNMFNQSVQQKTQAEMQRKPNMDLGQRVETENMAKVKTMQELRRGTFVQPGTETDAYQYAKSENQKVNEMNQSIVDAGGNNTQANREAAATAKRLIEDLGFNIKFTNNQQLQEQGQNVNGRNINGFVKDGTMYLNLDSDELANFTIGHETKHFFEANKEMNDLLNQSLKEYAQEKGIWDKRLAETTELYTDKDGNLIGDPEGELLADLTGEVFANYEFVNNLSIKNPSLFEKVRSFFQNLYYKATGQKEKLLIKQINDNLNKVYREYAKTQPGNKISSAETQLISDKETIKQEKQETKQKEENILPIAEKVEQKVEEKSKTKKQEKTTLKEVVDEDLFNVKMNEVENQFDKETYNLNEDDGTEYEIDGTNFRLNDGNILEISTPYTYNKKTLDKIYQNEIDFTVIDENDNVIDEYSIKGKDNTFTKEEIINAIKHMTYDDSNKTADGQIDIFNNVHRNNGIQYSLSVKDANTTQDNEGRELSKEQKEYFADSKITDDKGNLITVYHTTGGENVPFAKAQFNVFNPVGTPGYRYGDQVVNFFTDSKDMSGSYVDQNYKMADTSKVTSLNEAEGIVDYYNGSGMIDYSIQENDGKYELYDNEADEVLHTFDSQEDLFKNIKQTVIEYSQLDENPDIDGYQYEGYLNITNPYIIDAQGNEWSKIPVDNILDLKQEIKNKWDTPENQLKELTGDTLKELNKDLTKLGYQLMNDKYGDLALYTKNGQLASDMLNVNDVMQEIRTDLDNDLQTPISTNDVVFSALAENAMGANYDGVIIKNVVDYGGANLEEQTPNNVYVSFKDNQFKAADNTNPTTDSDIRYSLSNKDSQGRELSEQQQEFYKDVSPEMLDKNGNLKVLYHGSNITDITTFIKDKFGDKGITFLTDDADIADTYRNKKGRRYEVYANIKNPYVIEGEGRNWNDILVGDNPNTENMYNSLTEDEKNYLTELANQMDKMYLGEKLGRENAIAGFYQRLAANNEQLYDKVTQDNSIYEKLFDTAKYNWNETYLKSLLGKRKNTNQLVKEIYDSGNYDGIVFKNIVDRGTNYHKPIGRRLSNVYVTFDSNQVKNVDNTNPTDNPDIRYSLSKNEDSYLDELSEQQMEYFKDTKAVDKQGYLDVVFHGTPKDFTVFDISQADNVALGNGLYFTTSEGNAKSYAKGTDGTEGKVLEGYVNIVNPASRTEKTLTFDNFKKLYNELNNNPEMYDEEMGMSNIDALLSDYGNVYEENIDNILRKFYDSYDNDVSLIDNLSYMDNAKEMYKTLRDVTGLDGIIAENPTGFDDKETYYIIFNPDQFKLKSNKTPTINEDMRYSISQEGEVQSDKYKDLFPGMTRSTTRLSDLKRKEVELPMEEENALKTAENEQKQGEKPTRREVIDKNRQLAREQLGDITQIKDKKRGLLYQINTMKRNLRDIMTKEQAQKMYDTYFKDITTNNAKIENDITSYNERIQKYNLNDKESTYTQMIGELKHNPETTLTKQQVDDFYYKNANKIDQQKCENAVNEFRQIYDELIEKVNDVLTDNGYKPIEYRKGYFPHFIEEKATSKLGKLAEKLGWKVKKGQLPTDIAGITDQFKPGKAWTSFSQQRTGDATDYNALKGLDNYLRGAMDVIHHTNDIQKLRALENEIRYQYSSKGVQDKINEIYADENLDMEEKNDAIANLTSNIRESGLGNFVTEIRNYTDNLANKKAFGDRSMEQAFGRDVYSIMNNINGRVSANMVGANISSAITNFIPITQAWSQLSTKNLMRGMYESIKTSIKGDNFADRSTFLTNRTKQAERLYNTKMDKLTQKLGVPFEAIDSFTSNTIVRAKYYDNIAKGMSEQEAMSNADEFAKDVMAGRSKGDQPTIFNRKNPLFKLFTAFQLEVNNQYGYMFKDIPTNMADEAKRKLVGAFIKMFLGAWLYNEITEKFTGRRAAFDPIDMAVSDVKTLTNEDMDLGDKIQSIVKDTAQEVPFVSGLAGGGRLPIQGAIPYSNPLEMVTKTFEDIGNLDDPKKRKTAINNLKKEWSKPVYYLAFPVAGGQIKKTVEGLSMYDKDLPIAGSYTNSGKLRFEADTSTLGKVQAAVFGQYASKNAREYFKNGYTPLTEGQVEEALEAELPINEYREINQGIKDAKAEAKAKGENQTEAMYDYIYDLPIEMEQKNSLINSRTKGSSTVKDKNGYIKYVDDKGKTYWYDKKNDIVYNSKYKEMDTKDIADLTKASTQKDISNYGDYGSLAEFNYSNKNPEKYLALTKIADYDTFMEYKDELAAIKQKYDNQPTEFKKKKVFEYINSLPLSVEQKLMLQKMGAGYSIKQYRGRLHNYINNMELTKEQKQAIDKVLFD